MIRLHKAIFFYIPFFALLLTAYKVVATEPDCNSFAIDTLFTVKYGNAPGMLSHQLLNPSRFTATKTKVYILDANDVVKVYTVDGQFVKERKLNLDIDAIKGILFSKSTIVFTGIDKIYLVDSTLEVVDSLDYYPGSMLARQFSIYERVYFENPKNPQMLVAFDALRNTFTKVNPSEVWGTKNLDCKYPFFKLKDEDSFIAGASKKLIVSIHVPLEPFSCIKDVFVYSIPKRTTIELNNFCYDVYPTLNSADAFRFIDDTTAIFNVRYFNTNKVACECVFYRIRFSFN